MTKPTHSIKDDVEDVADKLEEVAENAGRYARKVVDQAPSLSEGTATVANAFREDPVKYSLIALGVGVVVGLILNRR